MARTVILLKLVAAAGSGLAFGEVATWSIDASSSEIGARTRGNYMKGIAWERLAALSRAPSKQMRTLGRPREGL